MNISVYEQDKTRFPNLALMKISSWHKSQGDKVEEYSDKMSSKYDKVYCSSVFTFNKTEKLHGNVEYGGTGIDIIKRLPEEIEHICPDYLLYDMDYSLGFLTRGCIRKCKWCFVPEKEGNIREHADIEEFLRHDKVVLLDNNVLASDHGIKQIEKIIDLKVKVDFNQGLDSRLIDNTMARLLSKVKWLKPLRLACDSESMKKPVQKAVELLRWNNVTPSRYFVYCLLVDPKESIERIKFLKGLYLDVFAQPFRDKEGAEPKKILKDIARFVDRKEIFKTTTWKEYNK